MYTLKEINSRVKRLYDLVVATKVPEEVSSRFSLQNLQSLTYNSGQRALEKRQFTPLVKQMISGDVKLEAPFTDQERVYIKQVASIINSEYGSPCFKYNPKYSKDNIRVKMWQNILRLGPKVTSGSDRRRYDNLQKYFKPQTFRPNMEVLNTAINMFYSMCDIGKVKLQGKLEYIQGLFQSHSSNMGYPGFRNETSKVEGIQGRDAAIRLTRELNKRYGAQGMVSLPATIIGRDQAGGLDMTPPEECSLEQFNTLVDKCGYKDSKARVVGLVDRLSNNNVNVVLKSIITSDKFKANPQFCGFKSREDRIPLYGKFHEFIVENDLVPLNIDFASFDTTLSAELLLIACDVIFSGVELSSDTPYLIQEAVTAKTIFTKYITWNPYKKTFESGMKKAAIPSGIGVTGLAGFICAQISWLYALITYYGAQKVNNGLESSKSKKTFFMTGLGDDLLAVVEKFSDLKPLAKIILDDLGMEISVDSIKTAVGIDFLQELFGDGKVYYPSARVAESALYSERQKGLGGAEGDMAGFSMLYNMRTNPQTELDAMVKLIGQYDITKLGTRDVNGMPVSMPQFIDQLKRELKEHETTAKDTLGDGDPAKETKYDNAGWFKKPYLVWCRKLAITNLGTTSLGNEDASKGDVTNEKERKNN